MMSDEEEQRSNWTVMESYLSSKVEELRESNFDNMFKDMFEVNILLSYKILARLILERCNSNERATLFAALTARLNSVVPELGATISREATATFIEAYNSADNSRAYAMISLLAELFNYEVLHEIIILQVIHLLSKDLTEPSVQIIVQLLSKCGRHLSEVSATAHNMVFEKLRQVLQGGALTRHTNELLQQLFELRSRNYKSESRSPLFKIDDVEHNVHTFIIDSEEFRPSKSLGKFEYHEDFLALEKKFDILKAETLALNQKEEAIAPTVARDMTGEQEVEFKKKFYLILKSSLSSDEAAHKILKLRIPDSDKHRVVDVIVKSSIQEATYSKFYGTLAERLCSSHKSWKPAFEQIFKSNYENTEDLEPAQLRTLGRFWGHILASDYVGLEVFKNVHMSEEGTTASGRIFLKFVFQEMVANLGVTELSDRFKEQYIQPFLVNLFPQEDTDSMRYSINYFTAIGLGILTENMRQQLDIMQAEKEKVPKKHQAEQSPRSRYRSTDRPSRDRSVTPPRRHRRTSVTPPRRNRSRSPVSRRR